MLFDKQIKILKDKELKVTQQRLEILKYLDENRTHPTTDDVYNYMIKKFPSISKMTIYSVIDVLIESKIIKSLRFKNSSKLHVDFDSDLHYNFVCKDCGSIYDINSDLDLLELLKNSGHEGDDFTLNIYGTCKQCKLNKKSG